MISYPHGREGIGAEQMALCLPNLCHSAPTNRRPSSPFALSDRYGADCRSDRTRRMVGKSASRCRRNRPASVRSDHTQVTESVSSFLQSGFNGNLLAASFRSPLPAATSTIATNPSLILRSHFLVEFGCVVRLSPLFGFMGTNCRFAFHLFLLLRARGVLVEDHLSNCSRDHREQPRRHPCAAGRRVLSPKSCVRGVAKRMK